MESMSTEDRQGLHALVDELPDTEVSAAKRYLQYLRDLGQNPAVRSARTAPIDDEPETEDEKAAAQEARKAMDDGDYVSHEDVRRELGL